MPVRHALSAKRGLPPLGLALATGINGSTTSHNPSGKSSVAIGQLPSVGMMQPFDGLLEKCASLDALRLELHRHRRFHHHWLAVNAVRREPPPAQGIHRGLCQQLRPIPCVHLHH